MDGHGSKNRQEKPKKAYVVLPYLKGVIEMLQRNMTSMSFAKPGT